MERLVVIVAFDGAKGLDIECVADPLVLTARYPVDRPYRVIVAAPGRRAITTDSGLVIVPHEALETVTGPLHAIVVSGGLGHEEAAADPGLITHVRRLAHEATWVMSVCTGATVLAATGLLNGRRVDTHWYFADALARRHPEITVDPEPVFICDGNIITSAGATCALDATLDLIQRDHGPEVAQWVAQSEVA